MSHLTMERSGKITLPETVRDRYRIMPETPIRMIETRSGVLLVPLTQEPMTAELTLELEAWQSLSAETRQLFPHAEV